MGKKTVLLLLLVAAFFVYQSFGGSDRSKIERLLADLSKELSFEQTEAKTVESLMWAATIADKCTVPCTATIHIEGKEPIVRALTKADITQHLTAARKDFSQIAVTLSNPVIQIDGNEAAVDGMGKVMGRSFGREDYFAEIHPVRLILKKDRGEWKISSLENLDKIDAQ